MAHNIILPKLGTNMTEATVVRWLKHEGDAVTVGEPLVEVETEKATFEVDAEVPGVLRSVLAKPGDTVPVAMPLGVVADPEESLTEHMKEVDAMRVEIASEEHRAARYERWQGSVESPSGAVPETHPAGEPAVATTARVPATPAARRVARELGIDIDHLARTLGAGRTIKESDVREVSQGLALAIFGAGLGASQIMDVLRFLPQYRVVALIDDDESLWDKEIRGYPVHGMDWLVEAVGKGEIVRVVISLHSEFRRRVFQRLERACPSVSFPALIHPDAYLGENVIVEDGALVEAGVVIGNDTVIRQGTIVDLGAVVAHHCDVGPFCHLAPRATLSGAVSIREHTVIMAGGIVANTASIGANVVVTPGSVVASDGIPDDVVVQGNPARIIGRSKRGA